MSTYNEIRLLKDTTVVAYFAPNFKTEFPMVNDLKVYKLPRNKLTKCNDMQVWDMNVVIQGAFETSTQLPTDHKNALVALFGTSPVTARMQVNRIRDFAVNQPGAYKLYIDSDQYIATTRAGTDLEGGIFPTVFIKEIRPPQPSGLSRIEYLVRFVIGYEANP